MASTTYNIFNSILPVTAKESVNRIDRDTPSGTQYAPTPNLPSYWNAYVENGGALQTSFYDAWCIRTDKSISTNGTKYTVGVYSTYSTIPTTVLQAPLTDSNGDSYLDNLQAVNWLLNNVTEQANLKTVTNGSYTYQVYQYNNVDYALGDVQYAIWRLASLQDPTTGGAIPNESGILNDFPVQSGGLNLQKGKDLANLALTQGRNFLAAAGQDIAVILSPGGTSPSAQPTIIEVKTAGIGDFVWHDLNANGIQDANETGIDGVTVKLLNADGSQVLGSTITGDNPSTTAVESGFYQFGPLLAGSYQVQFTLPTGFNGVSPYLQGSNTALDSNANPSNNLIFKPVTLTGGQVNRTIDGGFYKYASVGDFVFNDTNRDGIQNNGESGTGGVTVELLNKNGQVIKTTTTAADGSYKFNDLIPGEYQVRFTPPDGYGFTTPDQGGDDSKDSDANPTTGLTQKVTLTSGEYNNTLDAGLVSLVQPASLGDFVWEDSNGNGTQDAGEAGIGGVTVTLTGAGTDGVIGTTDDTTASTTTDGNGQYNFSGLTPGVGYQVSFSQPNGYNFTPKEAGGNDGLDSDADATGKAPVVTLASGENNTTIDAGLYKTASLGDFVWEDKNNNGIQEAGENGVGEVTVNLLDSNGNTISSTTTDANGNYSFGDLAPGQYQVQFVAPNGYSFGQQDAGSDDSKDSDANPSNGITQTVTLTSGQNNLTLDAALIRTASLGDFVWEDNNANGVQDAGEAGVGGVTVTLTGAGTDGVIGTTDDTTVSTTTDGNGQYNFSGLTPGVGYQVSFSQPNGYNFTQKDAGGNDGLDSDADAITGKAPVVTLASGENNSTIDAGLYKTASLGDFVWEDNNYNGIQDGGESGLSGVIVNLLDNNGNIALITNTDDNGNYNFSGLTPGQYKVQFVAPTGYAFTNPDANGNGQDTVDSDANPSTGITQTVTLNPGDNNLTLDAGLYRLASLGDRVWLDSNANGIQDEGEDGAQGVTVTLFSGGTPSATTTTDATGNYNFTGLTPGVQYQVGFSNLPTGYIFTQQDASGNSQDALDSDANTSTGKSQIVTLAAGENNTTIDAGIYKPNLGDLSITKTDGKDSVNLGEQLTYQIVVSNSGSTATNALVSDPIPSILTNVTWTSVAAGGATGNEASGTGSINDYVTLVSGSTITYSVTGTVASNTTAKTLVNTATVTAPNGFTDTDSTNNSATDTDILNGSSLPPAPGVRTPGFWQNNSWQKFWDGVAGNEPAQAGTTNFPMSDLMFAPYNNSEQPGKVLDPVTGQYDVGLLIGDYNRNGKTDANENTIFYTRAQALQIVDSSQQPDKKDVRYNLARDIVATWLNFLAANPIDTANSGDKDTRYNIDQGTNWLQALTPDENGDKKGDGAMNKLTGSTVTSSAIASSSDFWNSGIASASILPTAYKSNTNVLYPIEAGNDIHKALDLYNNTGTGGDGAFYGG